MAGSRFGKSVGRVSLFRAFCCSVLSIMIFLQISRRVFAMCRAGVSHLNTWHIWFLVSLSLATYAKSLENKNAIKSLRTDFTSNLVHGLAFQTPKFYIASYGKMKQEPVKLSSNCDVKSDLRIGTDRFKQILQSQIRLLLKEQSDQGLHYLLFHLHLLDA